MIQRILAWLDNPIIVKHTRSSLRVQPFAASAVVVTIVCVCIVWAGQLLSWFDSGRALTFLFELQGVVLILAGAVKVGQSVAGARASGILDFHRVSPVSPTALTLGFFFGAPVREYLLTAITLPFFVLCVALGPMPGLVALQLLIQLVVVAWMFHALALASALMIRKLTPANQGATGVAFFIFFGYGFALLGVLFGNFFVGETPRLSFFGVDLPGLLVALLYEVPVLLFLFIASRRKMASERTPVFSKLQAIACLTTVSVLLLGGIWGLMVNEPLVIAREHLDTSILVLGSIYVLVFVACLLAGAITPGAGDYAKGVRRAEKIGRSRAGIWDDNALNRLALVVLCAIVLVGPSILASILKVDPQGPRKGGVDFSLSIAIAVLVVAYIGLALQYFHLAFPKRGALGFGLFIFATWVLPVVVGLVLLEGRPMGRPADNVTAQTILSLCPAVGIALASGMTESGSLGMLRAAAFCPALVFMFLFNNLVTSARRKLEKQVRAAPVKLPSGPFFKEEDRELASARSAG